jgi:hypothetical protein
MNRRKKEQRRKDKRAAKQVASRNKSVHPLMGQIFDKAAERCPGCGASPRVPITCKQACATKEGQEAHEQWEFETDKQPHRHLECPECGDIGYLIEPEDA